MQNEIIINAHPGETRVAVLERSVFSELYIERDRERSVAGSVIKGRVSRVLPGMQAAFVDIGLEKAAFLYAGDYIDEATLEKNGDDGGGRRRGRNGQRREPPRIDTMLQEGQEIVVQVAKEPIGTKGARIISQISIPGRHLVLTPWSKRVGVSRRIDSDRERRRLRDIVKELKPDDLGFIIRTAGDGVREADLEADVRYLSAVWEKIQEGTADADAPAVLYTEPDLPLRVIRDFANPETKRIVIDHPEVHEQLKDFVNKYVADPQPRLDHYEGAEPIFDHFDLEAQIHGNLQRKVLLKSGGSLIVDQSEALTAIDVNTGRYVGKRDLEETVFKTNLEAVKEVVYQLRFRNIGGLIIIDLIDMESQENREKVYRALQEALRADKARTNILKISELGLVEMTRKRTRENLVQTLCEPCSYCEGRGYVLSRESVAFKVLREIKKDLPRFCGREIAVTVAPQVAEQLLTSEKDSVAKLGEELGRQIEIRARPGIHQEQFEVTALDQGPPVEIELRWLEDPKKRAAEKPKRATRSRNSRGNGAAKPAPKTGDGVDKSAGPQRLSEADMEDVRGDADAAREKRPKADAASAREKRPKADAASAREKRPKADADAAREKRPKADVPSVREKRSKADVPSARETLSEDDVASARASLDEAEATPAGVEEVETKKEEVATPAGQLIENSGTQAAETAVATAAEAAPAEAALDDAPQSRILPPSEKREDS